MWSVNLKTILQSAVEHGRAVIRAVNHSYPKRNINKHLKLNQKSLGEGSSACELGASHISFPRQASGYGFSFGQFLRPFTARLINGLSRASPLWVETRRKSAKKLFGETAPYFALVGVTLAGPEKGILSKQDEVEVLCDHIRDAISRAGWIHDPKFWQDSTESSADEVSQAEEDHLISLADLEVGSIIGKGCNAVVYEAQWKDYNENPGYQQPDGHFAASTSSHGSVFDIQGSLNDLNHRELSNKNYMIDKNIEIGEILDSDVDRKRSISLTEDFSLLLSAGGFGDQLRFASKDSNFNLQSLSGISGETKRGTNLNSSTAKAATSKDISRQNKKYPLAVKMLFNYEAASNAPAILNAMCKELLPAKRIQTDGEMDGWRKGLLPTLNRLPSHIHIVDMPAVFVDRIPNWGDSLSNYPQALPARINPDGYGRNMSLFCIMKRYDCTLKEYLQRSKPSIRTSLLLLAQLLESLLHLHTHGIAHRDLKSDNILIEFGEDYTSPHLVLTDFGCSLFGSSLVIPFNNIESDPRMGNIALMAPEVRNASPGLLSSINFSQCDLWAAATLAYEIFGQPNPFLPKTNSGIMNGRNKSFIKTLSHKRSESVTLDSSTYRESQIPKLPHLIPITIRRMVTDMLRKNPNQRPSALVCANLAQLCIWAPSKWFSRHAIMLPSHDQVTQWLLCLSTKVICEAGMETKKSNSVHKKEQPSRVATLEYEIVSTFLRRIDYRGIIKALSWRRHYI